MFVLVIRQREVGVPLIPLNALTGHRPALQRLPRAWHQTRAEHGVGFGRLSDGCDLPSTGNWDSGNPAFALSRGSHDGPPSTSSRCPSLAWHAVVPFTFRIQVSQQTQEPPSEFLPTEPGIQPGASWRTASDRPPGSPLPRGRLRHSCRPGRGRSPARPDERCGGRMPREPTLALGSHTARRVLVDAGAGGRCTVCLVYGGCRVLSSWFGGEMGSRPLPGALTPRRGLLGSGMAMAMANRGPPSSPVVMAE
jgi:hypothetical protein